MIAVTTLATVSPRDAFGLAPFMDGGIFINVEMAATHDTNLFANANEHDDSYFTVIPEGQYLKEAGLLNLDIRTGVEVVRFIDFTSQDTEDFYFSISLTYPNYPKKHPRRVRFNTGWRQKSATSETLGARIRSEIYRADLMGRNNVSDRLAVRGSGEFLREEFKTGNLSEVDKWSLSFDVLHIYSDNLESFVGYRYRHTDTEGLAGVPLSIDDHLIRVGAEGQLSAKVAGVVAAGVQQRLFGEGDHSDQLRPYGLVSITWDPRYRTALTMLLTKDFSVTPDDRSVDSTSVNLILNQGVYRGFSIETTVSYINTDIQRSVGTSRQDDSYGAGVGLLWRFASGASTALRYSYINQTSSDSFFEYDRHIVDLSAAISF